MAPKIPIEHRHLAEVCRRHHIRSLALFGSVLRDDFGPASDVDVLVEFEPDHVPGLDFFLIEEELSRLFGQRVDLNTPGFLGPELLDRVLAEAEVQFVQASFDPAVYGPLYLEYAAEDRELAEQVMADYARGLEAEDKA